MPVTIGNDRVMIGYSAGNGGYRHPTMTPASPTVTIPSPDRYPIVTAPASHRDPIVTQLAVIKVSCMEA